MYKIASIFIGGCLLFGCATSPSSASRPAEVLLCKVFANPSEFDGKRISVKAQARASSHFATLLYDPMCGNDVIALDVPKKVASRGEVDDFLNRVWKDYPKPLSAPVSAKFTGVFHYKQSEKPSRVLELDGLE